MPFTIANIAGVGLLKAYNPTEGRLIVRTFYYTGRWATAAHMLPGRGASQIPHSVDTGSDDVPLAQPPWWGLPAIDPSCRGKMLGLVEEFAVGTRRARLVTPNGYGSEPLFERMRPPNEAVVEMRTYEARTFGFFARKNVFVADQADTTENTHKNHLHGIYADRVLQFIQRLYTSEVDVTSSIENLIDDGEPDEQ